MNTVFTKLLMSGANIAPEESEFEIRDACSNPIISTYKLDAQGCVVLKNNTNKIIIFGDSSRRDWGVYDTSRQDWDVYPQECDGTPKAVSYNIDPDGQTEEHFFVASGVCYNDNVIGKEAYPRILVFPDTYNKKERNQTRVCVCKFNESGTEMTVNETWNLSFKNYKFPGCIVGGAYDYPNNIQRLYVFGYKQADPDQVEDNELYLTVFKIRSTSPYDWVVDYQKTFPVVTRFQSATVTRVFDAYGVPSAGYLISIYGSSDKDPQTGLYVNPLECYVHNAKTGDEVAHYSIPRPDMQHPQGSSVYAVGSQYKLLALDLYWDNPEDFYRSVGIKEILIKNIIGK